ncbi:hypothetical protein GCM10011366_17020 [Ornithinimicrobium tianjinense]|uniref:Uncharacterized protein n=1 Tax=Ornithinimicrobium tianjinense TaxID=1195761 RepID=A0A917BMM5_9MICO|nr:hypothetical protein GCM10011366_17020 [Ornithinimicrobium tianjinense]
MRASASAAIETNSGLRCDISMTDIPDPRQSVSSDWARSSTSSGIVAGPAEKLYTRTGSYLWGWVVRARQTGPGGTRRRDLAPTVAVDPRHDDRQQCGVAHVGR